MAVWELLDHLGISQKELARRSGVSEGYLSQLMRGERSPLARLGWRLLQVLGVDDFDTLFIFEAEDEPQTTPGAG